MEWRFYIDSDLIDEPIGWNGFVYKLIRDDKYHGVFFEASANSLTFIGDAAEIITHAKETIGIDANLIFRAEYKCEGSREFSTGLEGRINIGSYERTCGLDCRVKVGIEQDTCAMTFKNRVDQKVSVDSTNSMDGVDLTQYSGLNIPLTLPTQEIPISADAQVAGEGDGLSLENMVFFLGEQNLLVRPTYGVVNDNSILTGQLDNPVNDFQDPTEFFLLSPQVLLEENSDCISQDFYYKIRLKGAVDIDITDSTGSFAFFSLRTVVDVWDGEGTHVGPGNQTGDATPLHNDLVDFLVDDPIPFDVTYTGTVNIPVGSAIYAYIKIYYSAGIDTNATANFNIAFDPETSFYLYNVKECPPTEAKVYLVNETLARLTEIITDRCFTVKSDYYGRTDSQPYAHDSDGCGSLRALTSGLKIRAAEDKEYFTSFTEIFEGLKGIDNIGMGILDGDVRVEPVEFFYKDIEILRIPNIPTMTTEYDESKVYSVIKIGYKTWEAQEVKGILEFNSNKEFRTSVRSVNNVIDAMSNLIASGSIIESIRFERLLDTGEKDGTFDNESFIFSLRRTAYGYEVEQGIIENPENIANPNTAYNWRIRPMYNLMRWFKSMANSYINLQNTGSKLFFNSGTGNYEAGGNISVYDPCSLESQKIFENTDLDVSKYKELVLPIHGPDIVKFTYPMSYKDYELIKSNPYGYISIQCGSGQFERAYIKEIQYNISSSLANFTLIK